MEQNLPLSRSGVLSLHDAATPLIQFFMVWWLPTVKSFSLLLHNCNFVIVVNSNVSICVFPMVSDNPLWKGHWHPQRGHTAHWLRTTDVGLFTSWGGEADKKTNHWHNLSPASKGFPRLQLKVWGGAQENRRRTEDSRAGTEWPEELFLSQEWSPPRRG